jgi:predicted RNase H-like HicB family nuclease
MCRTCRGCIAAGRTAATVKEEIREAIRFHIAGLQADGIAVPQPTSIAEYVET